ncbi:MAG TPA: endonuclease III [Planctomycetota bacterium]
MICNIAKALRTLAGRYPLTMLGAWSAKNVDPFRILIGTILSARSRDEMTDKISAVLFARYPTAKALAGARRRDVEKILQPIGFYRTKAGYVIESARRVLGGVPRTLEGLMELPGVGRKVANCVLVYAFGERAIPVDTHVHRLSNRLGWVKTKTPEETERELVRRVPRRLWPLVNEALVAHGKRVCRPIGPLCESCPLVGDCAHGRMSKRDQ